MFSGILPRCFPAFPRCMGWSNGKRTGLSQYRTLCSLFPGLRRSADRLPDRGDCNQAAVGCGCSRCPRPLAYQFHYSGFGDFLQSCFGGWGLYRPVSREREQPFSRLPLWVAIGALLNLLQSTLIFRPVPHTQNTLYQKVHRFYLHSIQASPESTSVFRF